MRLRLGICAFDWVYALLSEVYALATACMHGGQDVCALRRGICASNDALELADPRSLCSAFACPHSSTCQHANYLLPR